MFNNIYHKITNATKLHKIINQRVLMKKIILITYLFLSSSFLIADDITVSILPQKYFVSKIVGDKFDINVMVKPGFSPASYEPKTSQMKDLLKSKVYFSLGVPFEKVWLKKFKTNAKNTLFVDTSKGIKKLAMIGHSHSENTKEHGQSLDPHIWLDPLLVKIQAKNIFETMSKIDSTNIEIYKKNYEKFLKELDELDKGIKKILEPLKASGNNAFIVFHPSWGYFAHRYDLEQMPIEVEGKEPKPSELIKMIKEAKEHNIKVVFVSAQFSQKSAKTISKNLNANIFTINPLSLDWNNNLLKIAEQIAKSYDFK